MDNDALIYFYGQEKKKTWRCEERLKKLCTAFDKEFPECTPAVGNRSSWYAGLRKILREFNEVGGVKFIKFAKLELQNRPPLDIVDAHSIGFLIPRFKKLARDQCSACREHWSTCQCEWGSKMRLKKYGGIE